MQSGPLALGGLLWFPVLFLQITSHGLLAHLGHDIAVLEVGGLVARDEQQAAIAIVVLIGRA